MSTDSERDLSIDRILRKGAPRRTEAVDGEACLDAETFAAWAEGALTEADAARVEAHLADCARCQSMMAAFATSEPVSAAQSTPAGAPVVIPFRPRSPMRWLIPVAAGTAAASLLVWTAWPKPEASVPASQTIARAEVPAPTSTPQVGELVSPPSIGKSEAAAQSAKLAEEVRAADPRSRASQERSRVAVANEAAKPSPASPAAPPPAYAQPPAISPAPRPLPGGATTGTATGVVMAPPPPPPPPPPPAQAQQQGGVRTEVPTISQTINSDFVQKLPRADRNALNFLILLPGTVEFGPADPRSSTIAGLPAAGAGRGGGGGSAAGAAGGGGGGRATAVAADRAIPLASIRWRVLPTGEVGKTTNAGESWQPIAIDPPAHVTSGSAPSATVCWLVGRAGVVLLSTDGVKFTPVTFPEAVDLRSITAIDARRATVTTADGRIFTTSDAGLSWK